MSISIAAAGAASEGKWSQTLTNGMMASHDELPCGTAMVRDLGYWAIPTRV